MCACVCVCVLVMHVCIAVWEDPWSTLQRWDTLLQGEGTGKSYCVICSGSAWPGQVFSVVDYIRGYSHAVLYCVCVYECVCVYMCMYVCVCMCCVCVCVCVCVYMQLCPACQLTLYYKGRVLVRTAHFPPAGNYNYMARLRLTTYHSLSLSKPYPPPCYCIRDTYTPLPWPRANYQQGIFAIYVCVMCSQIYAQKINWPPNRHDNEIYNRYSPWTRTSARI